MTEKTQSKTKIEPESNADIYEFLNQFDEVHVFGLTYQREPDENPSYRVVTKIEKVRPSAVPIDQPPTYDMKIAEAGDEFGDELRLTIEEIEHVRAADPSDDPCGENSDDET